MGALGFNPLARTSDRLEALTSLVVLGVAVLAILVAGQAGSQIYVAGVRTAGEQAHSRHAVQAVVLDGSASLPADFDSSDMVRVQWHEGTHVRIDEVITPGLVKAGQSLKIWLDGSGRVVAAPLTIGDAQLSAIGAAGTVWFALVACSALMALAIRRVLDRSREHAWERELRLLAHNDDGWANRHT